MKVVHRTTPTTITATPSSQLARILPVQEEGPASRDAVLELNLGDLSKEECDRILKVIQRDFTLRQNENLRLSEFDAAICDSASSAADVESGGRALIATPPGGATTTHSPNTCVRCRSRFLFLLNPRENCPHCGHDVCRTCAVYDEPSRLYRCRICTKQMEFKSKSCDWFYNDVNKRFDNFGSARVVRSLYKRRLQSEHDEGDEDAEDAAYTCTLSRPQLHGLFELNDEETDILSPLETSFLQSNPAYTNLCNSFRKRIRVTLSSLALDVNHAVERRQGELDNCVNIDEKRADQMYNSMLDNHSRNLHYQLSESYSALANIIDVEDNACTFDKKQSEIDNLIATSIIQFIGHPVYVEFSSNDSQNYEEILSEEIINSIIEEVHKYRDNPTSDVGGVPTTQLQQLLRDNQSDCSISPLSDLRTGAVTVDKTLPLNIKCSNKAPLLSAESGVCFEISDSEEFDEIVKDNISSLKPRNSLTNEPFLCSLEDLSKHQISLPDFYQTRDIPDDSEDGGHQIDVDTDAFSQGSSPVESPLILSYRPSADLQLSLNEDDDDLTDIEEETEPYSSSHASSSSSSAASCCSPSPPPSSSLKIMSDRYDSPTDDSDDDLLSVHSDNSDWMVKVVEVTDEVDGAASSGESEHTDDDDEEDDRQSTWSLSTSTSLFRSISAYDNYGDKKVGRFESMEPLYMHMPDTVQSPRIGGIDIADIAVMSDSEDDDDLELEPMSTLTEETDPKFSLRPAEIYRSEVGGQLTVECNVVTDKPTDIFWYRSTQYGISDIDNEFVTVTGADSPNQSSLSFLSLTKDDRGQYLCLAINEAGRCCQSFKLKIKAFKGESRQPEFIRDLADLEMDEGRTATFRVKLKGYPTPAVLWYKDGRRLPDVAGTTVASKTGNRDYALTLTSVTADSDAEYMCIARNVAGSARCSAQLIINPIASLPSPVSTPDDRYSCTPFSPCPSIAPSTSSLYPDNDELLAVVERSFDAGSPFDSAFSRHSTGPPYHRPHQPHYDDAYSEVSSSGGGPPRCADDSLSEASITITDEHLRGDLSPVDHSSIVGVGDTCGTEIEASSNDNDTTISPLQARLDDISTQNLSVEKYNYPYYNNNNNNNKGDNDDGEELNFTLDCGLHRVNSKRYSRDFIMKSKNDSSKKTSYQMQKASNIETKTTNRGVELASVVDIANISMPSVHNLRSMFKQEEYIKANRVYSLTGRDLPVTIRKQIISEASDNSRNSPKTRKSLHDIFAKDETKETHEE